MHSIVEAQPFVAPLSDSHRFLPEGPQVTVLDGRWALSWVNIQTAPEAKTGELHFYFFDTGERRILPMPGRPGFALPTGRNQFLCGMDKVVGFVDAVRGAWKPLATIPDAGPHTIINDGELTEDGKHLFFGTKDVRFLVPIGHLYHCDVATGEIEVLLDGQTCSNGKIIVENPAGFQLFDIDTPTRKLMRYTLDRANHWRIEERTLILDLSGQPGFPDGMVSSAPGRVIIAFYNSEPIAAGRAVEFDLETGEVLREFTTPGAPRVTCPAIDRPKRGEGWLYLTTCTEGGADLKVSPNSGAIFRAAL